MKRRLSNPMLILVLLIDGASGVDAVVDAEMAVNPRNVDQIDMTQFSICVASQAPKVS